MDKKLEEAMAAVAPEPLSGRSRYLKNFWYGEYGSTKTITAIKCVLACNPGKRCLVIATDTGTDSIYNHPELVDLTDVVPYSGLSQLSGIAQATTEKLTIGGIDYSQYGGVVPDTISQMQEEYLDWLLENFKFSGNFREKAVPTASAKRLDASLTEQEITGMPDYHLARNNMRGPIKALIKAPVDVYFLAHLREPSFLEQGKGKLTRRPTLTETVFKLIAREASTLGYLERKGDKKTIAFETNPKWVAKSRIKELDNKTINVDDLPEILHKWKEAK